MSLQGNLAGVVTTAIFQHYKNGKTYQILSLGVDTTDNNHDTLVHYREVDIRTDFHTGTVAQLLFTRKAKDFFSDVTLPDGSEGPRFKLVQQ